MTRALLKSELSVSVILGTDFSTNSQVESIMLFILIYLLSFVTFSVLSFNAMPIIFVCICLFHGKSVMSTFSVMLLWCHYYMCMLVYKID